ncbi:ATP-dependent RNA helicase DHX8-like isoform X2 [Bradysia coprophila]|uniref:ATP-dependent RNA helicase DHX8-like isoform X2 n=1 Tax=Bradysia coprophila TaxID=38358 RepID=UPI00187D82DD|nr:ATP-dependent RNA helicase DHX8-like isoform X2 [Bradysia coprophila]
MGSSTSREEPTPERRPNAIPTVSSYQPWGSYRSPADPRHQPTVSQHQSAVSHRQPEVPHCQPEVPRREPAASHHPSSASPHHQLTVSQHGPTVSNRQPEVQRREPTASYHPSSVSHKRNDYESDVNTTGDAFVRSALEKCNCETVLQVFVDNEIDRAAFLLLTEDDLKTLLPTKMGPRKKIWEFIQGVRDAAMSDDGQFQDIQSSSTNLLPHVAETIISEQLDHLDLTDEMPQPVTALTPFSPNTRTGHSSSSYDYDVYDDENIGFTNEPAPPQVVVNRMNQMTLNMQIVNHHHNRFPDFNFGTDLNRFVAEEATQNERHGAEGNVMAVEYESVEHSAEKHKQVEHKNVDRGSVRAGNKQKNFIYEKQQSKPSVSKNVPHPSFPSTKKLPIYQYKSKFLKMVENNPVVIVIAETGSGKSTQMPQYLARANYDKKIICTQPRRLAAKSLAKRVACEFGTKLGQQVGYRVRFDNCTENTTKISYVTEGVLVHELSTDATASNYSVVIIDEAHERNLNTDVLLGCLKKAVASRPDLKVVISSATVEAKKFSKFFDHAPVLDIPGRSFPVDIVYDGNLDPDYLTAVVDKVCLLHSSPKTGDILVFLPGQEEIEHAADTITTRIRDRPNLFLKDLVLPLYSKLPSEQQNLIFEPAPPHTRKIILATNIAETSLTIDGIVFVVDSGMVKQAEYVTKGSGAALECTTLVTIRITKAQAKQRSGRAGRTQPGVAYRLYSEATYNNMAEAPKPEILRGNLEMVVLLLFSMGVTNILQFEFLDSPPMDSLLTALEKLEEFGALTKSSPNEYCITSIGRQMSSFPLEPYLSKMLIMSADVGCSEEMLTIIAILSAQVDKLFKRPKKKKMEADLKKKTFDCPEGDHVTLLKVYNEWLRQSNITSRAWCKEFYLDWKTLEEAYEIRCQLSTMLDEKKIQRKSCDDDMTKVQIAIASGSFRKIAWKTSRYAYFTFSSPRDDPVLIHPSSVLFTASPSVVIYNSIIKTKKAYMSQVLQIDIEYIQRYAPNFYRKLSQVLPYNLCDTHTMEDGQYDVYDCVSMLQDHY